MSKRLWILTEERPKHEVIGHLLNRFVELQGIAAFFDTLRIIPMLNDSSHFSSTYQILGFSSPSVSDVMLKVVSGNSSFVDYLVYFQKEEPTPSQRPLFVVEETKTDDAESRNTGVFQRATKFVYVDVHYPGINSVMLYNLQIEQKQSPTDTNIFGTRCLRTLGVELAGKTESEKSAKPFSSVDELIELKAAMRRPPAGNVPILVTKEAKDRITVSGRLFKAGGLAHDPNIGALSLICATLRKLGWNRKIEITHHGLQQSHLRPSNKFVQIANHLNIGVEGLNVPDATFPDEYWRYETTGEKLGTIFLHLVVEEFSQGFAIYENHAGCERGYFRNGKGEPIQIGKRLLSEDGTMPKDAENVALPDLILIDPTRLEVINVEGERAVNVETGIQQLKTFTNIENAYIRPNYPGFKIIRTVVLYGGKLGSIENVEVSLLVNSSGKIVLGVKAPRLFHDSITNLLLYWKRS
jgi:hypothetical protein